MAMFLLSFLCVTSPEVGTQKNMGFWVGFGFINPNPYPKNLTQTLTQKTQKSSPKPNPKNPKYVGFKFF